jgi:hypothetical protein
MLYKSSFLRPEVSLATMQQIGQPVIYNGYLKEIIGRKVSDLT